MERRRSRDSCPRHEFHGRCRSSSSTRSLTKLGLRGRTRGALERELSHVEETQVRSSLLLANDIVCYQRVCVRENAATCLADTSREKCQRKTLSPTPPFGTTKQSWSFRQCLEQIRRHPTNQLRSLSYRAARSLTSFAFTQYRGVTLIVGSRCALVTSTLPSLTADDHRWSNWWARSRLRTTAWRRQVPNRGTARCRSPC